MFIAFSRLSAHGFGLRLRDGVDVVEDEGRLGLEDGGLRLLGDQVGWVDPAVERLHLDGMEE